MEEIWSSLLSFWRFVGPFAINRERTQSIKQNQVNICLFAQILRVNTATWLKRDILKLTACYPVLLDTCFNKYNRDWKLLTIFNVLTYIYWASSHYRMHQTKAGKNPCPSGAYMLMENMDMKQTSNNWSKLLRSQKVEWFREKEGREDEGTSCNFKYYPLERIS